MDGSEAIAIFRQWIERHKVRGLWRRHRVFQYLEDALLQPRRRHENFVGAFEHHFAARHRDAVGQVGEVFAGKIFAHPLEAVQPRHIYDFGIIVDVEQL